MKHQVEVEFHGLICDVRPAQAYPVRYPDEPWYSWECNKLFIHNYLLVKATPHGV
jgi:hypothetical protein